MNLKYLNTLTPAEVLMMIQGTDLNTANVLKVTFMDLILKQALRIDIVERQPSPRDSVRTYRYVMRSVNFDKHERRGHEWAFFKPFADFEGDGMLLSQYAKIVAQESTGWDDTLRTSVNIRHCFDTSWITMFGGNNMLNDTGKAMKKEIKAEKENLERNLPLWYKNGDERAMETLRAINGNLFVLTGIDIAMRQQMETMLAGEFNQPVDTTFAGSGCTACATWDTASASFDSSCSGGGDGGCGSGCGGCGGGGD